MKKIVLIFLIQFLLFSCSTLNKSSFYEDDKGTTLEFNIETKKYIYWGLEFQGGNYIDRTKSTLINYSFIYFEGDFQISKGLFHNKYLLDEPRKYYYLPFNTVNSSEYIEFCNNLKFSENRIEFKKTFGSSYKLTVNQDFDDKNDCMEKLSINGVRNLKPVKKIDFKDFNFLDKTSFRLIKLY
jgi:hypothetical protein